MSRGELLQTRLEEAVAVCQGMLNDEALAKAVDQVVEAMVGCLAGGGKLLLCGNGGSAADAQHLAAELIGRFQLERQPLPAVALADNVAAVTATANDYAFSAAFSRAVEGLGSPGDVLVALTTSGQSANVIAALVAARKRGMRTVAFVGPTTTNVEESADYVLSVPGPSTARIQEGHMVLGHTIVELVERELCLS